MHDGFSLPQASWIALLSIAHRYEFLNVRNRAIREIYGVLLQQQDPLRQSIHQSQQEHLLLIAVAEKYDVPPQYTIPSLVALVMRAQSLSEDEVARLSAITVSRIAHARENFVRRTVNPPQSQAAWLNTPNAWLTWVYGVAKDIVCNVWPVKEDGKQGGLTLLCAGIDAEFGIVQSHQVWSLRNCLIKLLPASKQILEFTRVDIALSLCDVK